MGKIKFRLILILSAACLMLTAMLFALMPVKAFADAAGDAAAAQNARNEKLVVRYALDDTSTGNGAKLKAQKWDSDSQSFAVDSNAEATIQNHVNYKDIGAVTSVDGIDGTALKFTKKAHARANFRLPGDATGMTVSLWVKDINTYWSSLIEFWDGSNGGRFGKGTMQGNGGRSNEGDPWSANCPAHDSATIAEGGGWDSFCINVNNSNNGGAAVDPMVADRWYFVSYVLTANEMKAYRNGELKQTFNKGESSAIVQSIMTAVKSDNGKLGIRLGHDSNDGDILDDLRIYSYAMTAEEVKEELISNPNPIAMTLTTVPDYYDEIDGLGYPEEMLFDGATSVSKGSNGTMTGVTARGVSYSYRPLSGDTTPAKDSAGVKVTCSKDGYQYVATLRFRRKLNIQAESLGYKIGNGEPVPISVPETSGEDIIVRVAAGTDLSNVKAGDIAVKMLDGDSNAAHYKTQFLYSAKNRTALVRCSYASYANYDTVYTIRFVESRADTFSMSVTGGKSDLQLTKEDFTQNSKTVPVNSLTNFILNVSLTGAKFESGASKVTFTHSDLENGKFAVTVTNNNGESTVYYLVPAVLSSEAKLGALSAGSYGLTFEENKTAYEITVGKGEGANVFAAIRATATDANATVKKSYDNKENVIIVTVTAADGVTAHKYVIEVKEIDTDATLKEIKADGVAIASFDPDKIRYAVKYEGDELPVVTFAAASDKANTTSQETGGKVTITVTAENGATKEYTVTLMKKGESATLTRLTLNGTEIVFEGNTARYQVSAGTRLDLIKVNAETAEGEKAVYKLSEENHQIIVTVTAEDGSAETTYTVTVDYLPYTMTEGGVTEDNSPESSGCNSSVGGTAISVAAIALTAGIWLFVKKERKTR